MVTASGTITMGWSLKIYKPLKAQRGATMLELAIFMPLFLVVLFILIGTALIYNAKSALHVAVNNVRYALTRGQSELVGSDIITDIQGWKAAPSTVPPGRLPDLLATPAEQADAFSGGLLDKQTEIGFPSCSNSGGGACQFVDLPASDIYAHVYVAQTLLQGVGAAVRIPCDPNAANGAGCVLCRSLNESEFDDTPSDPSDGAQPLDPSYNTNWIGIECQYRPSSVWIKPIEGMLALIGGGHAQHKLVITARSTINYGSS